MKRGPEKPIYWRSFAELENDPEFLEFVEHEFREPMEAEPPNSAGRRRFMQLMGASFALTGATGCRWPEEKLVPLSRRPNNQIPGEPKYYATTFELGGAACEHLLGLAMFGELPLQLRPGHAEAGALAARSAGRVRAVEDTASGSWRREAGNGTTPHR